MCRTPPNRRCVRPKYLGDGPPCTSPTRLSSRSFRAAIATRWRSCTTATLGGLRPRAPDRSRFDTGGGRGAGGVPGGVARRAAFRRAACAAIDLDPRRSCITRRSISCAARRSGRAHRSTRSARARRRRRRSPRCLVVAATRTRSQPRSTNCPIRIARSSSSPTSRATPRPSSRNGSASRSERSNLAPTPRWHASGRPWRPRNHDGEPMEHRELRHLIAARALDSLEPGDADRVERAIET